MFDGLLAGWLLLREPKYSTPWSFCNGVSCIVCDHQLFGACRCKSFRRMTPVATSLQKVAILLSFLFKVQAAIVPVIRSAEVSAATVASVNYEGDLVSDIARTFPVLTQSTRNGTCLSWCNRLLHEHTQMTILKYTPDSRHHACITLRHPDFSIIEVIILSHLLQNILK